MKKRYRAGFLSDNERGLTLIEVLGALALGAVLTIGIVQMLTQLAEDRDMIAVRRHHQMLADTAAAYVEKNWQALLAQMEASGQNEVLLPLAVYREGGGLPQGWSDKNPLGQTSCLIVNKLPTIDGQAVLSALLIAQGGKTQTQIALMAASQVQTHGAGTITADSAGIVRVVGFGAQWQLSATNNGGYLSGNNCEGSPWQANRLATLLHIRSSEELAVMNSIMRQNANADSMTTMTGGLSLSGVAATVVPSDLPLKTLGYACNTTEEGQLATASNGAILMCGVIAVGASSSVTLQWQAAPAGQLNIGSATRRVEANALVVDEVVTTKADSTCYRIGELARIADGGLAYCGRNSESQAPSDWRWRKSGGSWQFNALHLNKFISVSPITYTTAELGLPNTARVAQISVFAQSASGPVSIKINNNVVARTCCWRHMEVPLVIPADKTTTQVIDELNQGAASGLHFYVHGYIGDAP